MEILHLLFIMILSETVEMKMVARNAGHYRSKGYDISQRPLVVRVQDLAPRSNCVVRCRCDVCGAEFDRKYNHITQSKTPDFHRCTGCFAESQRRKASARWDDNPDGFNTVSGDKHWMWNPNKRAFRAYRNRVDALTAKTYEQYREEINPHNHPRTLCGVPGGWQLDHVVSIKRAFELGWTPEQCADRSNLQMLPWETNRAKWDMVPTVC